MTYMIIYDTEFMAAYNSGVLYPINEHHLYVERILPFLMHAVVKLHFNVLINEVRIERRS